MVIDIIATPSIPSSSPLPTHDAMDVSPMLGRVPHCNIEMLSPTTKGDIDDIATIESTSEKLVGFVPTDSLEDEEMIESPAPMSRQSSFELSKSHAPEYVHCHL